MSEKPRSEPCLLIIDHSRAVSEHSRRQKSRDDALTPFTLFKCESACMSNGRVYGCGDTHERARSDLNVPSATRETRDYKLEMKGRVRGGARQSRAINFTIDFRISAPGKRPAANDLLTEIANTSAACCVTLNTGTQAG